MTKTKLLKNGIPVADAVGNVTIVSVDELAKRIGEKLGVQTARYRVSATPQWIRIAEIGSASGIIQISNAYGMTLSRGIAIVVSGIYRTNSASNTCLARILCGDTALFDKLRFVTNNEGSVFVEVQASGLGTGENYWDLSSWMTRPNVTNQNVELFSSFTEGAVPEGYSVTEYTFEQMKSGGGYKYHIPSVLHCFSAERSAA